MKRFVSYLLVLCLLFSLPIGAFAEKIPFHEDSEAIQRAAESILLLTCYDNEGNAVATGSGFLAFEDGIIVTNYHVIEGITGPIKANTEDGMYFDINEILCFDQTADVAILKTKAKTRLDLLTLAASSSLGKGSRVVAIGSPLGLLNIVSEGIYSGIVLDETEYILFTAAISSGSSGGALFNENGEVIGVTAATYTEGQNLNLAVPIENVWKLWNQYQSGEYVETVPIEQTTTTTEKATGEEAFRTAEQYYEEEKYSEAIEWYTKAAEQGYAEAQYMLAECYYDGKGVEKNYSLAVEWYEAAAEKGNIDAQVKLGICYLTGNGVEEDLEKAFDFCLPAAEQGNSYAQLVIGGLYLDGTVIGQDYNEAIKWLQRAADQENVMGQYVLGYMYYFGEGIPEDHELAFFWLKKSAEQGLAEAQYMLGECYVYDAFNKDWVNAVKWYTKAAEQGHVQAQNKLGECYTWGWGVQTNYSEAIKWYLKAVGQGNYDGLNWFLDLAKSSMSWGYYIDAEKMYLAAAEAGIADAQCALGNILYFGQTGKQDYQQATYWYEKAAEQNQAEANYRLAQCYEYGMGVEKDKNRANELYAKARQLGYSH